MVIQRGNRTRAPLSFLMLACLVVGLSTTGLAKESSYRAPRSCRGLPATMVGTASTDRLVGTSGADVIVGLGGNDIIRGRGGVDRICAGPGSDSVDAGAGEPGEFALYGDEVAGGGGNDYLVGGAGTDLLLGGGGADRVLGSGDGDELRGGAGDDALRGGDGDDLISADGGDDDIDGGAGLDTSTYEGASGSVTVDLSAARSAGAAGRDRIAGIEMLIGSPFADDLTAGTEPALIEGRDGNDTISGSGAAAFLFGDGGDDDIATGDGVENLAAGGPGNDAVQGGLGDDSIYGDEGNDTLEGGSGSLNLLEGGLGDDVISGDSTTDIASYSFSTSPIVADLAAGTAIGEGADALIGIEGITGSAFDDVLTGDSGDNLFLAGPGNDQIFAADGLDGILAGEGDDTVDGGTGDFDFVTFFTAVQGVDASLTAGTAQGDGSDSLAGIEILDGSNFDDRLVGNEVLNILNGNLGDDEIDGAAGFDIAGFGFSLEPVTADLATGTASGDGIDSIVGVEGFDGSPFADVLAGDASDNIIFGQAGDDALDGRDGIDQLDGGAGTDSCNNGESVTSCESASPVRASSYATRIERAFTRMFARVSAMKDVRSLYVEGLSRTPAMLRSVR